LVGLSKGIYTLRVVENETKISTFKLVVQ
jgi:hypothetical protein